MTTNLLGPYYLTRLLLPHLRERGTGVVLNVSSRAGTVPVPFSASYAASKAALINLTATLQAEIDIEGLGDGIQAYSLHPGGVKSAMVDWSEYMISAMERRDAQMTERCRRILGREAPGAAAAPARPLHRMALHDVH